MENIVLYSTGCPKCRVLKQKLESKNVPFEEVTSVDEMKKNRIWAVPVLKVGERMYEFTQAIAWVNRQ